LAYSYLTKDDIYYYIAGVIALSSTFYHEAGIIIFTIWLSITALHKLKKISLSKKDIFFIFIILISNLSTIENCKNFIIKWTEKITKAFFNPQFNFLFPLKDELVNTRTITENAISFGKTYLGYAGPVIIFSALIFLYLLFRRKINIFKYWAIFKKSCELQILFIIFFITFVIAEVFPRFPGIVLFPDRAWLFVSIFFSIFIILFAFKSKIRLSNRIYYIYIALIILSIGGAIYGNYFKKFLITNNQIQSTEWIKEKLPSDRLIITTGSIQLLENFGQSNTLIADVSYFHNENEIIHLLDGYYKNKTKDKFNEYIKDITSTTNNYSQLYLNANDIGDKKLIAEELTLKNIDLSKKIANNLELLPSISVRPPTKIYIYYSEISKKNPSFKKSGTNKYWGMDETNRNLLIFEKHPEKFKKIYEKGEDEKVIIWEVL
jgi:hypothetical protein